MRATLKAGDLHRAMSAACRGLQKSTIPVLGFVKLSYADGALTVTGTDLDITVTAKAECVGGDPGTVLVPARSMRRIMGAAPTGMLVTLTALDGRCRIDMPDCRFSLMTLPVEDFPDIGHDFAAAHHVHLPAEFTATLNRLIPFISGEEIRYYLCGVCLHELDGKLACIATDGHRLARQLVACKAPVDMARSILPRAAVEVLRDIGRGRECELAMTARHMRFVFGNVTVESRLIDGTYPDYNRVIPKQNTGMWLVDRRALLAKLSRLAAMSEGHARPIELTWNGRDVVAATSNADIGSGVMAMPGQISGVQPGQIGTLQWHLLDACAAATPGKMLQIAFSERNTPFLVTGDDGAISVCMPCRYEVKADPLPEGVAA